MNVKERVTEFINHLGISVRSFEMNCNLSNGLVNNLKYSLSKSSLDKISNTYPELNTSWLLTGEGPMLKTKREVVEMALPSELIPAQQTQNEIKMQTQQLIDEMKEELNYLKKQLEDKQKAIDRLFESNQELLSMVAAAIEAKKKEAS